MTSGHHRGSRWCCPVCRPSGITSHRTPASQRGRAFRVTEEAEVPGWLRVLSVLPTPQPLPVTHHITPSEPHSSGFGASRGQGSGPLLCREQLPLLMAPPGLHLGEWEEM